MCLTEAMYAAYRFPQNRFDKTVKEKPRRLPPGFFTWWWQILLIPEDDCLRVAGLDMAVFLRILTFGEQASSQVHSMSDDQRPNDCSLRDVLVRKRVGLDRRAASEPIGARRGR